MISQLYKSVPTSRVFQDISMTHIVPFKFDMSNMVYMVQVCMPIHCKYGHTLQVFKPSIPFSLAWLVASSALHFAPVANCFISVFVFLVCMSQQFHAWGHMKKSELPAAVVSLQVHSCH